MGKVYDSGSIFDPSILDITDDDLKAHVLVGIRNIAALCLKIGYPTVASVPHSIINGLKNCMAVAAVTDITFKEAEKMKSYLADPSAFAVAAPVAVAACSHSNRSCYSKCRRVGQVRLHFFSLLEGDVRDSSHGHAVLQTIDDGMRDGSHGGIANLPM